MSTAVVPIPPLSEVVAPLLHPVRMVNAERIQGFMPLCQLEWLATAAQSHSRIAEVGCWRGRTTACLCDNTPGTVTAIDTWRGSPGIFEDMEKMKKFSGDEDWVYNEFLYNMKDRDNLEIRRGPSLAVAAELYAENRRFDMIFIDALHDFESVRADIRAWWPLIEPGGIMCGHDFYSSPDVRAAVDSIFVPHPDNKNGPETDIWLVKVL